MRSSIRSTITRKRIWKPSGKHLSRLIPCHKRLSNLCLTRVLSRRVILRQGGLPLCADSPCSPSFLGIVYADSKQPLLLQKPTLSKTQIAFVYARDLWKHSIAGAQLGQSKIENLQLAIVHQEILWFQIAGNCGSASAHQKNGCRRIRPILDQYTRSRLSWIPRFVEPNDRANSHNTQRPPHTLSPSGCRVQRHVALPVCFRSGVRFHVDPHATVVVISAVGGPLGESRTIRIASLNEIHKVGLHLF